MILLGLWCIPSTIDSVGNTYNYVVENGITGLIDILHDAIFGLFFWGGIICVIFGGAWGMSVVWMYR